jgi:hypothetical protein
MVLNGSRHQRAGDGAVYKASRKPPGSYRIGRWTLAFDGSDGVFAVNQHDRGVALSRGLSLLPNDSSRRYR